jgi:hypothetical protein
MMAPHTHSLPHRMGINLHIDQPHNTNQYTLQLMHATNNQYTLIYMHKSNNIVIYIHTHTHTPRMGINLHLVNATDLFLNKLKGVTVGFMYIICTYNICVCMWIMCIT